MFSVVSAVISRRKNTLMTAYATGVVCGLQVEFFVRGRNCNYDKMHIVLLILLVLFNPCVSKADEKGFSFIYAADSPGKIVIFDSDGKSAWEYPAEMARDVWKLPNGNVLFPYNLDYNSKINDGMSGVMEVTPDKKVVLDIKTKGQVFTCQRLPNGETLVGAASQGKLLIFDGKGSITKSITVRNKPGHSCMRYARALSNGNFIVAEESARAVREYSAAEDLIREFKVDFPPFGVVRLENGNTVISGKASIVELDSHGKEVWRLSAAEVPLLGVRWFAGFQVLPNGNLFVCNAGGRIPFFEITRDTNKRMIWQSKDKDSGIPVGHGIQRLDSCLQNPLK